MQIKKEDDGGMWRKKVNLDANFTAEAALVVPVVIAIIFAVIYMTFYLYDRTVVSAELHRYNWWAAEEKSPVPDAVLKLMGAEEALVEEGHAGVLTQTEWVRISNILWEMLQSMSQGQNQEVKGE